MIVIDGSPGGRFMTAKRPNATEVPCEIVGDLLFANGALREELFTMASVKFQSN
jgi:hypothetical protein